MYSILLILLSFVLIGETPTVFKLTDQEKAEYAQLNQAEQQQTAKLLSLLDQAVTVDVGPITSVQYHASIREGSFRLSVIRAQQGEWLAKLRLNRNCKDCVIEGDVLTLPKK